TPRLHRAVPRHRRDRAPHPDRHDLSQGDGAAHARHARRAMTRPTQRTWHWRFSEPPEKLWPVLSDTARLNEAAKLPSYAVEDIPQPDGSVLHLARTKIAGLELVWEEPPYEWVRDRVFR